MVANGDADRPAQRSHLFMLRLWLEDLGNGQTGWRGKIQHVNSSEVRYFRNWATMEAFVEELVFYIKQEGNLNGR